MPNCFYIEMYNYSITYNVLILFTESEEEDFDEEEEEETIQPQGSANETSANLQNTVVEQTAVTVDNGSEQKVDIETEPDNVSQGHENKGAINSSVVTNNSSDKTVLENSNEQPHENLSNNVDNKTSPDSALESRKDEFISPPPVPDAPHEKEEFISQPPIPDSQPLSRSPPPMDNGEDVSEEEEDKNNDR